MSCESSIQNLIFFKSKIDVCSLVYFDINEIQNKLQIIQQIRTKYNNNNQNVFSTSIPLLFVLTTSNFQRNKTKLSSGKQSFVLCVYSKYVKPTDKFHQKERKFLKKFYHKKKTSCSSVYIDMNEIQNESNFNEFLLYQ